MAGFDTAGRVSTEDACSHFLYFIFWVLLEGVEKELLVGKKTVRGEREREKERAKERESE